VEQVLTQVVSEPEGLSYVAARQRLRQWGPNRLPRKPPRWLALAQPLASVWIYGIAAIAAVWQWQTGEGWAIALVAALHGLLGLWFHLSALQGQERNTQRRQSRGETTQAVVKRDREWLEIPSRAVVVGDVVAMVEGDRPTVDVYVWQASEDLAVNQTELGGDGLYKKQPGIEPNSGDPLTYANLIYAGSEISQGEVIGIVVATGAQVFAQRFVVQDPPSLLHQQLRQMRRGWVPLSLVVAIAVGGLSWGKMASLSWEEKWPVAGMAVISLALATYPQNWLRLATLVQVLGIRHLARQRLWVRTPSVLDALGRVHTIALVLESDTPMMFDDVRRAGIHWKGLIRADEADAVALGETLGLELHSLLDVPQEWLRLWQQQAPRGAIAFVAQDQRELGLLRQADVGICHRSCRRDVVDSAGLVLPRPEHDGIVAAILEGRAVFDRMQRVVVLGVTCAFALLILTLNEAIAGLTIVPMHLLWVGGIVTPLVSLPLILEPTSPSLLLQPRRRFETMLRRGTYLRILLAVSAVVLATSLVFWLTYRGETARFATARTMALTCLVCAQGFHACAIARHQFLQNVPLIVVLGGVLLTQVALVHLPILNNLFITEPLAPSEWLISLLAATGVFWIQELIKPS
jgi:magnesium-transporting ATPase (P-type)